MCILNNVQPVKLLKTVEIKNVDKQQTLLILPHCFVKQFSPQHLVTFKEVKRDTMLLRMIGPHDRASYKPYRLVTSEGATWVSVPRLWLRNLVAREGDRLDVYSTLDPLALLVKFRKAGSMPSGL